ncbi:hypothetical protein MML48_7g00003159 [Holotrichia oblita]|uniref:Uncharacterized protein n=1 Tax=Holotrichia oblita TaxID=644536 RepID=A0ACB9SVH3_HOLOL|nr:hypothetical protein MML48_7g00003159 [Holotrichia oblita]
MIISSDSDKIWCWQKHYRKDKKRWNEEHVVKRRDGTGRKRCTTENDDAALLNFLRDNPFETAVSPCEYVNFPGSIWAARKRIKCREISNYSAARKPYLPQENTQQKIAYAQEFLNKNNDFWKKVIFSDEKVFQSFNNGRMPVYRPRNSRYDERYTQNVQSSGRFSANMWGWISYRGGILMKD